MTPAKFACAATRFARQRPSHASTRSMSTLCRALRIRSREQNRTLPPLRQRNLLHPVTKPTICRHTGQADALPRLRRINEPPRVVVSGVRFTSTQLAWFHVANHVRVLGGWFHRCRNRLGHSEAGGTGRGKLILRATLPQAAPKRPARVTTTDESAPAPEANRAARRERSKSLPTLANTFRVRMPFSCTAHFSFSTAV